jgi:hypothetical protein
MMAMRAVLLLALSGCVVPATVHEQHTVASHPTDVTHPYGPEIVWLDATSNGGTIEIRVQSASARKREVVESVDEHSHREAQFRGLEDVPVRASSAGDVLIIGAFALVTVTVSSVVTGVVLLFSRGDERRFDRPGQPIVETSARPASHLVIRVFIGGDRTDVETDDSGLAQVRLDRPAHVVIETARRGDAVLIFDHDPAKPLAAHEHPQPPLSGGPQ